jgi:hypothetical protein
MAGRRQFLIQSSACAAVAATGLAPGTTRATAGGQAAPVAPVGPGRVLGPGPAGRWDSERVSSPCVLRGDDGVWRMWYYGRDPTFDRSIDVPTGRIGLATSNDGLRWQRVDGPGTLGAVLDPSGDPRRFDAAHVGVSFVERRGSTWWMWYSGGRRAETARPGFPMRPGLALSGDGVHWLRVEGPHGGAMLDPGRPGEPDEFMVGWPQVLQASDGSFRMYYHTRAARGFLPMLAVSEDGFRWQKRGVILEPGPRGSFDEAGIATRTVFRHGGRWLMLYEGVAPDLYRGIGLAESADGLGWRKVRGAEPNGAAFDHAPRGSGRWDARGLGCPSVVAMPDGSLRMYYIGANELEPGAQGELSTIHQIGLAVSNDGDPARWRRWDA